AGRGSVAKAMSRTVLLNRRRLANGSRSRVINVAAGRSNRSLAELGESLVLGCHVCRLADERVFCIGGTGAKGDSKSGKSELLHFFNPFSLCPRFRHSPISFLRPYLKPARDILLAINWAFVARPECQAHLGGHAPTLSGLHTGVFHSSPAFWTGKP